MSSATLSLTAKVLQTRRTIALVIGILALIAMFSTNSSIFQYRLSLTDVSVPKASDKVGSGSVTQQALFEVVSVEAVKAYWDRKPCNSGWQFPGLSTGTKEWFEAVSDRRYKVEPHSYDFAGFASSSGLNVLEIGGGICTDSLSFALNGANITIVDLSTESLVLCRRRFELFGIKATIYQGSAMELSSFLPAMKFDVIYSYGVIHHMPHPEKCMAQLRNFLKSDGQLRIMLYTKFSYKLFQVMHETRTWDFSRMDSMMAKHSEAQTGSPVTYTYTAEEATEMFARNGFEVTKIWKDHIFAYDLDEYKRGKLVVVPELRSMHPNSFQQMKKELGWHLLIYARLA